MKLKNYTSGVPIPITIGRIEAALITAGVNGISKEYGDSGRLEAICFTVKLGDKVHAVRLTSKQDEVARCMQQGVKRYRKGTIDKINDQAGRTAWKIVQDWVLVELTRMQLGQAEFLQVFLPYLWDGKRTFYDALKEQHFKALPGRVKGE